MEKEQKSRVEDLLDSLFEEANEIDKFDVSEAFAGKQKEAEASQVWEDGWEEEFVTDEFSLQLKQELESNASKS